MAGCWRSGSVAEARDLVIGIGNPLRSDDGVGWWLARMARRLRPMPRVLLVQQLTPELVEDLALAQRVLFIDAWLPQGGEAVPARRARLQPLQFATDGGAGAFSHHLDPQQLLAITAQLHGRAPAAWQLLLPAHALAHGARLSGPMRRQLPAATLLLRRWCDGDSEAPAGLQAVALQGSAAMDGHA